MNTKGKTSIKENKPMMTASTLMRLAGVSAMLAGVGFIIVGMFHPLNIPSSVTTAAWINVHIVAIVMGFFGLFGMVGLYVRQAEKSGWLGLAGFLLFSIWLALVMPFSFVEAFILPRLATELPKFVAGFLGIFTGIPSEIDLGCPPNVLEDIRPHVSCGTPAVWHCHIPRWHPAALGGRFARRRLRVGTRRCTGCSR